MRTLMIALTPPMEGGSQWHVHELSKRIKCNVLRQKYELSSIFLTNIFFAFGVYCWSLRLLFGKKRYDIIHIHDNLNYFLAPLLMLFSYKYKTIISVHGMSGFKFYDNKFLWFLFKNALKHANKLIAVNLEDKKRLEDEGFKDITYIPNGVDTSIYKNINPKIEKKITFIGRVHEQKGIIYLLKAFKSIKTDYKLEIIGDTDNDYATRLMLEYDCENIIWRGSIKDRKEIVRSLKSAQCIVLPSVFEGLPLTLFEALASGRPVIVSDIPAFKSIIKDEALFFKSKNAGDLSKKIKYLLDNKTSFGQKGKELAKNYDWNIIAKQTMEVYNG